VISYANPSARDQPQQTASRRFTSTTSSTCYTSYTTMPANTDLEEKARDIILVVRPPKPSKHSLPAS
jgi:hypothetical protein